MLQNKQMIALSFQESSFSPMRLGPTVETFRYIISSLLSSSLELRDRIISSRIEQVFTEVMRL